MAAKAIGKYAVQLTADARPLVTASQQARQALSQVGDAASSVAGKVAQYAGRIAILAGLGAAIAAPIVWFKRMADAIADADKAARKLGVSIGEMRGLNLAGAGGAFTQAAGQLNLDLARAAQGDLTARDRFAGLGGTAGLAGGPEALAQVLDRLAAIPNAAQRAGQAFRLLGDVAEDLLPFLGQGGGGVRAAQDQARRMGLFVGENDLKTAKEVKRIWQDINAFQQGVQNQVFLAIAPIVAELRSMMDLSNVDISGWRDAILDALETAALWSARIIDALGDGTAWGAIKAHAKEFGAILLEGIAAAVDALPSVGDAVRDVLPHKETFRERLEREGVNLPPEEGRIGKRLREQAARLRGVAGGGDAADVLAQVANLTVGGSGTFFNFGDAGRGGRAEQAVRDFAGRVRARQGGNDLGPGAAIAGGFGNINAQALLAPFVKEVAAQFAQQLGGVAGADPARQFQQAINDIGTFTDFGLFQGLPGAREKLANQAFQRLADSVQMPGTAASPGAALAGSREAYSAIVAFQRQEGRMTVQEQMKALLEEARRQDDEKIRIGAQALEAQERIAAALAGEGGKDI